MIRRAWIVAVAMFGCGSPDPAPPATSEAVPQAAAPAPAAPPDAAAALPEIGPDGIGAVRAGMTLAEIRSAMGDGLEIGDIDDRFMVDLSAMPVVRGQDTILHLMFPAHETPTDATVPLLAVTDNPAVRTIDGVGPGSTLSEAAAIYGGPTLRYSANDEMREYATFPLYDHPMIRFRVAPGNDVLLAGRYEQYGEYGETTDFDGHARIMMVMVELRRD